MPELGEGGQEGQLSPCLLLVGAGGAKCPSSKKDII